MTLILHQAGREPLGQFDGYFGETLLFKGGEICTWAPQAYPAPGAYDVDADGYVISATYGKEVPGVSRAFLTATSKPLFLSDDGIAGYGTLLGVVVGGLLGQQTNGPYNYTGAVIGPHTATGSGKITLWDKPGLYGTTLDAVDTTLGSGLIPTNTGLAVGAALTFTNGLNPLGGGLLTPGNANGVVARFASFESNGSLVTTPSSLVAALSGPGGTFSNTSTFKFTQVVYWFGGAGGNA